MSLRKKKNLKTKSVSKWPLKVRIFEVGPRDGLQAEITTLNLDQKIELVTSLVDSGLTDIEVGSFVKAERIPQLANTEQLLTEIRKRFPNIKEKSKLWAFVPNEKGLEHAIDASIDGVSFFIATSNTFCQKNVNRTRKELEESLPKLLKISKKAKLKNRVYLSTLVFCPYEGFIAPEKVFGLVDFLVKAGVQEIVLSDTTGDANPRTLNRIFEKLIPRYGADRFALHLHDTRGLALANILEGLGWGIRVFDSSIAGLGGCPYAPGASGNLATEDLANMLLGMGLLKQVDLGKLSKAGFLAEQLLGRTLPARMLRALEAKGKVA
jgi:hydroxymethylglutaryl-CoA lyase